MATLLAPLADSGMPQAPRHRARVPDTLRSNAANDAGRVLTASRESREGASSASASLAAPAPASASALPTATRWISANERRQHNDITDLWVSWLGSVYDLTPLAQAYADDPLLLPILKRAGQDLSDWFDPATSDLRTHVHPLTGTVAPFTPDGRFLHVPPVMPRADWSSDHVACPWWLDRQYHLGSLSRQARHIRIVNTLTQQEDVLEVCGEETLTQIQDRYLMVNSHAKGYMWKYLGALLDMTLTLQENGIPDETAMLHQLAMDPVAWLPTLHVYFSDDLTVA